MSIIAIDIGVVNTAVRVESLDQGEIILHEVFTPDTKNKWLDDLVPYFTKAKYIGVERQVAMNGNAVKLMKSLLWTLLDLQKQGSLLKDCVWGYILPTKKTPKYKRCVELFSDCCKEPCLLSKTFHSQTNTKSWAVFVASHILLARGETSNPIFTAKKRDDLADVVLYCELIRKFPDEMITQCLTASVKKLLEKDIPSVSDYSVMRVSIALL